MCGSILNIACQHIEIFVAVIYNAYYHIQNHTGNAQYNKHNIFQYAAQSYKYQSTDHTQGYQQFRYSGIFYGFYQKSPAIL